MSNYRNYIIDKLNELHIAPQSANMVFFWKPYPKSSRSIDESCCCQWWLEDFEFEGVRFRSAEHAMMHGKAKLFNDPVVMQKVLNEPNPSKAKKLGREVKNFNEDVWQANNYDLIVRISLAKFTQSKRLNDWLLSHPLNTLFVEASPFDELWGIKRENNGQFDLTDINTWRGYNKLGFALTHAFQELKSRT